MGHQKARPADYAMCCTECKPIPEKSLTSGLEPLMCLLLPLRCSQCLLPYKQDRVTAYISDVDRAEIK